MALEKKGKPTFADLFAGIGGFRIGFEMAGYDCVFSCDNDQYCQDVYRKNFSENPFGDIKNLNPSRMPDFDVLLAGFPCQPFSASGKRLGFQDTRGTLFFDICRIIQEKNPSVVVLENVKNMIYHDRKRTLKTILASLKDLDYRRTYAVLNAKDFGVPQNRERLFIIATKERQFDFFKLRKKISPPLKEFLDEDGNFEILEKKDYTLIDKPKMQKSGLMFAGYRNKRIRKNGVRPNTEHLSRVHKQPNRIYSIDGFHPTIPSQETSGRFFVYDFQRDYVRKLTLDECYRIMGFPDDFKKSELKSEAYKQVGNSVCVPLVYELAKEIQNQGLIK